MYDKAGMKESGAFVFDRSAKPLAMPLTRDGDKGWKEAEHGKRGSPAGGGYSTVRDMLLYSKGLKTNAFVSAESLKTMATDKTAGLKDAFPYGYGFIPQKNGGEYSYGHGGIASGINLEFRYFPRLDITLVVFSNQDNGAFDDLRKNMVKLISGER
jgi:CubicO group peptidase (beta-lactamase class C family)